MLVLSRNPDQTILIGPDIKITVVRVGPNSVRLGIDAPPEVNIVRGELVGKPPTKTVRDFRSETRERGDGE